MPFLSFSLFFSLKKSLQNYQNKQTKTIKCSTSNENWWKIEKMCCWSLLTSHGSGSREVGWLWALRCLITWILVFHSSPQLTPRMERDSGWGGERRREGSGEGNGGWMVVWWEDQTHCHSEKKRKKKKETSTPSSAPRAPPSQPSVPPTPPLLHWKGQTSTDWIWFICARIIWTLLRIFFWWPANVTPTLRMSLLMRDRSRSQTDVTTHCKQPSIFPSLYLSICFSIRVPEKNNFAQHNENKTEYKDITAWGLTGRPAENSRNNTLLFCWETAAWSSIFEPGKLI